MYNSINQDVVMMWEKPAMVDTRGLMTSQWNASVFLAWTARVWFCVALIGQWIFAWYIITTYAISPAQGEPARWDDLPLFYALTFIAHVGLAAGIFIGGPLQLIAPLRVRFPVFHRWNGRFYLLSVVIASVSGLYMIWFRSDVGGLGVQLGTSIGAFLSAYFGWQAISFARAGDFTAHRRHALRLFITAASIWFFRLQLMLWLMLSGGKGINPETFHGPALVIVSFTQYLIPLLILELYFAVETSQNDRRKIFLALLLIVMSLLTALGVYAASVGMWFP